MSMMMIFNDLEEEEQCIFELYVYVCVFFRRRRDKENERERGKESRGWSFDVKRGENEYVRERIK